MNDYVPITSLQGADGDGKAQEVRDFLKRQRIRVRLVRSMYVGHRLMEIHGKDLARAAKHLRATGYKWIADECARRMSMEGGRRG